MAKQVWDNFLARESFSSTKFKLKKFVKPYRASQISKGKSHSKFWINWFFLLKTCFILLLSDYNLWRLCNRKKTLKIEWNMKFYYISLSKNYGQWVRYVLGYKYRGIWCRLIADVAMVVRRWLAQQQLRNNTNLVTMKYLNLHFTMCLIK